MFRTTCRTKLFKKIFEKDSSFMNFTLNNSKDMTKPINTTLRKKSHNHLFCAV